MSTPRATINVRRLPLKEQKKRAPTDYWRPSRRGDCEPCPACQLWRDAGADPMVQPVCGHTTIEAVAHSRPCLFVSCSKALFLDVKPNGNIRLNFPKKRPDQLVDSCSLDLADEGGLSLLRVGEALGVTREMIRQMETAILQKCPVHVAGGFAEPDEEDIRETAELGRSDP